MPPGAGAWWRAAAAALLLAAGALLSGCANDPPVGAGAQPSTGPSVFPIVPKDDAAPQVVGATGPGNGRAIAHGVTLPSGAQLPDRRVTPGSFFPDVTAADICDLHYVLGVRQPRFNAKVEAFANYGVSTHDRDVYQVDRLVPVSLGGNNAVENLWPQPSGERYGAQAKDRLERQLRGLVCSHKLSLATAQQAIATNWWQAYQTYMGLAIDPGSAGLAPWTPPTSSPGEVTNGAPCPTAGKVGFTDGKHVRLTCTANSLGQLRWAKRY
jgi:hypothetical protein